MSDYSTAPSDNSCWSDPETWEKYNTYEDYLRAITKAPEISQTAPTFSVSPISGTSPRIASSHYPTHTHQSERDMHRRRQQRDIADHGLELPKPVLARSQARNGIGRFPIRVTPPSSSCASLKSESSLPNYYDGSLEANARGGWVRGVSDAPKVRFKQMEVDNATAPTSTTLPRHQTLYYPQRASIITAVKRCRILAALLFILWVILYIVFEAHIKHRLSPEQVEAGRARAYRMCLIAPLGLFLSSGLLLLDYHYGRAKAYKFAERWEDKIEDAFPKWVWSKGYLQAMMGTYLGFFMFIECVGW